MEIILIILGLTFPVFYIVGLITFIRWIINSLKTPQFNKKKYLEMKEVAHISQPLHQTIPSAPSKTSHISSSNKLKTDMENFWDNWYSENSINVLLYIGAFLIVAAASIFVGFQWEQMSSYLKASILSLLSFSFIILGLFLSNKSKVKNAAYTFTGIGSLLIPFSGLAWHKFVLAQIGVPFGITWTITSIISLIVYIFLVFFLKSRFYTYLASMSVTSLSLSLINIQHLKNSFYIPSALISSLVILYTRIILKLKNNKLFNEPLENAANITMIVAVFFALFNLISSGTPYTIENTLSSFLILIYFFSSYFTQKKTWALISTYITISITMWLCTKTLTYSDLVIFYIEEFIAFFIAFISYSFNQEGKRSEAVNGCLLSIIQSIFIFAASILNGFSIVHLMIFSSLPVILSSINAFVLKQKEHIAITATFLSITIHLFLSNYLKILSSQLYIEGLIFLAFSVFYYILTVRFNRDSILKTIFSTFAVIHALLAIALTSGFLKSELFTCTVISLIFFHARLKFKNGAYLYFSITFIFLSLTQILKITNASLSYYPLAFSGLSVVIYILSLITPEKIGKEFKNASIITNVLTPIIWGASSIADGNRSLETSSLITSYITTLILSIDAATTSNSSLGYAASAAGMITYLWQVQYLNVTETQVKVLPLGIYFMSLAYIQRIKNNIQNRDVLDFIGLFFLFVPCFFQIWGENGFTYALLFGIEGIIVLSLGISLKYSTYIFSGIAVIVLAVVSQIYTYILEIPKWLIIGGFGILFLSVAVYLSYMRKDSSENQHD